MSQSRKQLEAQCSADDARAVAELQRRMRPIVTPSAQDALDGAIALLEGDLREFVQALIVERDGVQVPVDVAWLC